MGLAAIKVLPDPLPRLYARHPRAQLVIFGGLIIAGTFTLICWVFGVPSLFGYGGWPTAPWWM